MLLVLWLDLPLQFLLLLRVFLLQLLCLLLMLLFQPLVSSFARILARQSLMVLVLLLLQLLTFLVLLRSQFLLSLLELLIPLRIPSVGRSERLSGWQIFGVNYVRWASHGIFRSSSFTAILWRCCLPGRWARWLVEFAWPRGGGDCRAAMVC